MLVKTYLELTNKELLTVIQTAGLANMGGGWGGGPPNQGLVPLHQGLSPPIQKIWSPPMNTFVPPPGQKFSARFARNSIIITHFFMNRSISN